VEGAVPTAGMGAIGEIDMTKGKNILLFATFGIAAVGVVLFGIYAMWWGLNISINIQNVGSILATLMLIAGFIERAVEVVITPWRDPEAKRLRAVHVAKMAVQSTTQKLPGATPQQVQDATKDQTSAREDLNAYKGQTTRYAFAVAFMFSLVAAMVGVRALWPFLSADTHAMDAFHAATLGQKNTFIVFDVVLSATLMTGGADGIHSVVSAFTSFFDASSHKSKDAAAA